MGSIALASPFVSLTDGAIVANQSLPHFGTALMAYKYSGALIDFALSDANGGAHAFSFTGVPTDATALELWVNANGSTDYLFMRHLGGTLSNTGVLASNITANLAGQARWVASGAHMVIPLQTVGAVPSTLRFAFGVASGARVQGRYISSGAGFPYALASTTEDVFTGAAAQVQLVFASGTKYPQLTATVGVIMQIYGSAPARITIDGTAASATNGDMVPAGTYLIDFAKMGISITALRIFLPTGTNIISNALSYA